APLGRGPFGAERVRVREPGPESVDLVAELVPPGARPLLREAEPLVAEDLAEEPAALGRAHLGEELELLLPGEVGVEELLAAHREPLLEVRRDAAQARRDGR